METEYGEWLVPVKERYDGEVLVETTVDAAERGGAEKILSLEAEAKATGVELMSGEAEVTGKVNYRLLYLDRQKRLCGLDYFKDFKCRVQGEEITPNGKYSVRFTIPDAEATVRGEEIALAAMTGIELTYYGERAERTVCAVKEAETLAKKVVTETVKRTERTVELDKVVDSGPSVKKIVLFGVEAVPLRISEKEGGAEFSGEVRANVLYLNEADEAVELTTAIPFAESFDVGEASYGVSVKNARIVLTEDEGGGAIEVEVALVIERIESDEAGKELLVAAVGERSEVDETLSFARCHKRIAQCFYEETLSGVIAGISGDYLAFLRPGCHAIAEVSAEEGAVKVEGVAAFQAVTLGEEGYDAAQGELPFTCLLPCEKARKGQKAEARVTISEVKGTIRTDGLAVTAKISIDVILDEESEVSYLSDAVEGEPYLESEAGISVYFAEKGEDPWRIAKAMKVLPSALVAANPFLAEPLTEDKKVLILRKK